MCDSKYVIELLPHNQKIFEQVCTELKSGKHSILISEATGLGKSFIFMSLVERLFSDKRILYVVPKIAIWENVKLYKEFNEVCSKVDMVTYADFNNLSKLQEYAESYDVLFIDEAHHLESEIQGRNIHKLIHAMMRLGKFVFGMTATPFVNGIFIDDKYFESAVYGMNLLDAISSGKFPKIRYELGVPEILDIPEDKKAVYDIDSTKTMLEQVIEEHGEINHWLAFFSNVEELNKNEGQLKQLFPGFKIFKVYSNLKNTSDVIDEFNSYSGKSILMSVSMLLEGMHLKHSDGVLLYRNVVTNNTMLQIIGRICKAGSKQSPLFIDITNSIKNIKDLFDFKVSKKDKFNHVSFDVTNEKDRKEILICSQKTTEAFDFMKSLEAITVKEYRGVKWTTKRSLAVQLGKSLHHCSNWLGKYPDKSEEDYIDSCLGSLSYEEYVANGYSKKLVKIYRGINIADSDASLARALHKSYTSVKSKISFGLSREEVIDSFLLDTQDISEYADDNFVGYYVTRGLKWSSATDARIKLGFGPRNGRISIKDTIEDINKIFDSYSISGYRGVKFGNMYELSLVLGIGVPTINKRLNTEDGLSIRKLLNDKLGDDLSDRGAGLMTKSIQDLAKTAGFNCTSMYDWVKRGEGRTKENYVQLQLQKISKETGITFNSIGDLASSFNTTPEDINNWLYENHATLKEYLRVKMHELAESEKV